MKKLSALLLSAGLLFSITGCSSSKIDDDALTTLENGMNQMSNMESASYDADMNLSMIGETMNIGIHGGYLEKDSKLNLSMIFDAKDGEEDLGTMVEIYYTNDHLYLQYLREKMDIDMTEIIAMFSEDETDTTDKETNGFKKDDIKPYLTSASLDGDKITLEFNNKKLQDAMKQTIQEAGQKQGYDLELEVKKATAIVKLEDGFIVDAAFDMDTTLSMDMGNDQNTTTDLKVVLSIAFDDINANQDLAFPDFKDYVKTEFFDMIYGLSKGTGNGGQFDDTEFEL